VFTGSKRTCQAQLDQHNASRRKHSPSSPSAAPETRAPRRRPSPAAALVPCSDSDAPATARSVQGSESDRSELELRQEEDALDALFNPSAFASNAFDLEALLELDHACAAPAPSAAGMPTGMATGAEPSPVVRALADEVAASLRAYSVHVKLPHADDGAAAGLPTELSASLVRLLGALGVPPAALTTCVRPGCVLITFDCLTSAGEEAVASLQPGALLAALAGEPGAVGAFARSQASMLVRVCNREAAASPPTAPATQSRVVAAPRPPPLAPLALLSTADGVLTPLPSAAPLACPLACRLGADVLRCELRAGGAGGAGALLLPASGLEGVLLVEALPEGTPLHRAGAARPVLLTRDADIAAEVATTLGGAGVDRDIAERAVLILGAALRPDAASAVLAPAAALAARLGLSATAARGSVALRARCAADGAAFEPHFLRLLQAAAAARQHAARRALLVAHADAAAGAALAASLLCNAARDGHALLPCALQEASHALAGVTAQQPHIVRAASAVLAAMAACSADADAVADDADDEAEGAAVDAALADVLLVATHAHEAGYIAYLCDVNLGLFRTTALLALFVRTVHTWLYVHNIRSEPSLAALMARGAVLRKQVHSLRFYDAADLSVPPMTVLEYPWEIVQSAAPLYMAWIVFVNIPTHATILLFVSAARLRPFLRRHYERLFGLLIFLELLTYILMDIHIFRVTGGRVARYAIVDCAMHALGVLFFHRTGMFGLRLSLATMMMRSCVTFGVCVWTRAWGILLWPENAVQLVFLVGSMVLAPGRDRRLRLRYAQHVAAAAAAAAAAEPLTAQGKHKAA
jgi:hypothetical protein